MVAVALNAGFFSQVRYQSVRVGDGRRRRSASVTNFAVSGPRQDSSYSSESRARGFNVVLTREEAGEVECVRIVRHRFVAFGGAADARLMLRERML